ncbi:hypothetical protein REJC140_03990 [Pseudorhizobium endolithicum]|uniref:Flagellar motor protein MotA n=1 Tax=Pseudorhizobium endolithicum TaxID=1191678 RepID=A0ABM8PSA1_9HYPH|nr:hypothetical protein [Pseudorhizobium endolithicum]CAD7045654.1 hypothetical protein REJC140_03990 [Pseudorhizobium endolithicum]
MLGMLRGRWLADRETRQRDQHAVLLALIGMIGAVVTGVCLVLSQFRGVAGAVGLGGLILFAASAAGASLGFLFSVPRVLSTGTAAANAGAGEGAKAAANSRLLGSNTNLERISEWLTTMIVGVGLSQVTSIGAHLRSFTGFLEAESSKSLAAAGPFILIVGLVSGFVFLYLYTRLYLSPLFLHVEKLMSRVGDEELPVDTAEIRSIAKELAGKNGGSVMSYIANVDRISLDQTMHVLNALLYEEDGYRRVLEIGENLEDTVASQMARYWYLMAAANGQRHHQLLLNEAPKAQLAEVRRAVLNAARRAVDLDPGYRRHLAALTRENERDDDLQDFAQDRDFLRIVR